MVNPYEALSPASVMKPLAKHGWPTVVWASLITSVWLDQVYVRWSEFYLWSEVLLTDRGQDVISQEVHQDLLMPHVEDLLMALFNPFELIRWVPQWLDTYLTFIELHPIGGGALLALIGIATVYLVPAAAYDLLERDVP